MTVDEPGAIPAFVAESRVFIGQNDHTWVVLHKTASGGTALDIASYFATNADMHSTHYVVGQDGAIVQCVSEADGAGGNCCIEPGHAAYLPTDINLNLKTISIEHVDPAPDNSTPLTDAQKAASFRLVRDICLRHNIPMRAGDAAGGIIGHHDIAPISRAHCPGNYPLDELLAFLEVPMTLQIADTNGYFTDLGGDVWHCTKTGVALGHAMLDFYRQAGSAPYFGLALFGLPRTGEIAVSKSLSGVVLQVFERGVLYYDPQHVLDNPPGAGAVYPAHIDGDGPAAKQLLALWGSSVQPVPIVGIDPAKVAAAASLARSVESAATQLVTSLSAMV